IAYRLASGGASVTLVERDSVGSHASGFALGLLNPTNATGKIETLVHQSYRLHRELHEMLQEESGVDLQLQTLPHIELGLAESEIEKLKSDYERIALIPGFKTTWLEPDEVRKLESRITNDLFGAMLVEDVVMLDSYNLTLAMAQAAEARGTEIVLAEATEIIYQKNRAVGVRIGQNRIDCDAVVLALGPWSGTASIWLDIDVPIVPQKGEIARVEGLNPPLEFHVHGPCSLVQKADGLAWLAATRKDNTGFDVAPSVEALETLVVRGMRMMPELESHQLILQTACMRPVTPDGDPVLGRVPGKERMFIATGTGGQGIMLAPAIGKGIADLVTTGDTDMDIGQFGLERFAND
ncbi:FAD-binding oxidoreductase, partial [Dehalococcoides mccartyi]|nr:FAD-binding oxidoreductase [Dehalococcoides mccartyi]